MWNRVEREGERQGERERKRERKRKWGEGGIYVASLVWKLPYSCQLPLEEFLHPLITTAPAVYA